MKAERKITVHVPEELLDRAREQTGQGITETVRQGLRLVAAAETRYRSPAYYEDALVIETTLEKIRGKILKFSYRVLRGEESLAEGRTTHIVLNAERRPTMLPPVLLEPLTLSG